MYIYIYIYIYTYTTVLCQAAGHDPCRAAVGAARINISLLSLQTQPNLFQRGVEYGKYEDCLTQTFRLSGDPAELPSAQPG